MYVYMLCMPARMTTMPCMYVSPMYLMYECMYVSHTYECMYVCTKVCMHVSVRMSCTHAHVCMYAMYVCMYVMYVRHSMYVCMHVCMYVCRYVCTYVCTSGMYLISLFLFTLLD